MKSLFLSLALTILSFNAVADTAVGVRHGEFTMFYTDQTDTEIQKYFDENLRNKSLFIVMQSKDCIFYLNVKGSYIDKIKHDSITFKDTEEFHFDRIEFSNKSFPKTWKDASQSHVLTISTVDYKPQTLLGQDYYDKLYQNVFWGIKNNQIHNFY